MCACVFYYYLKLLFYFYFIILLLIKLLFSHGEGVWRIQLLSAHFDNKILLLFPLCFLLSFVLEL